MAAELHQPARPDAVLRLVRLQCAAHVRLHLDRRAALAQSRRGAGAPLADGQGGRLSHQSWNDDPQGRDALSVQPAGGREEVHRRPHPVRRHPAQRRRRPFLALERADRGSHLVVDPRRSQAVRRRDDRPLGAGRVRAGRRADRAAGAQLHGPGRPEPRRETASHVALRHEQRSGTHLDAVPAGGSRYHLFAQLFGRRRGNARQPADGDERQQRARAPADLARPVLPLPLPVAGLRAGPAAARPRGAARWRPGLLSQRVR